MNTHRVNIYFTLFVREVDYFFLHFNPKKLMEYVFRTKTKMIFLDDLRCFATSSENLRNLRQYQ